MRGPIVIGAALVLSATTAAAAANEQPICAARPGRATSTCTVLAGHFQLETGLADWTLQKGGGERETSLTIGETTFKYGLTDRSDIEVDVTPWQRATSRGADVHGSVSGFGDIAVGYKQQLTPSDATLHVTVLPVIKIPAAKRALGNGRWEGGVLLPMGYAIPGSQLSIAFTPELDWIADADGHGHHAAMVQVADLGWAVTSKVSLSAEISGQWDWDLARTRRQTSAHGSIAYLVSNDVQLDAGGNFGLDRNAPDIELYTGISKRF